jgi:hypothetical protein
MSQAITSLPRPVLLAIVGAAAVLALLFATRRGSESSPSTPAPAKEHVSNAKHISSGNEAKPNAASAPKSGSTGTSPAARPANDAQTLPAPVKRALDAHKVVLLLFWNPNGSDDRSVKQSFDAISRHGGAVAKFTDTLRNLSRYTRLTASQPVAQTPTVVVVNRNGKGRFMTGFQDSATVDQLVVDALK